MKPVPGNTVLHSLLQRQIEHFYQEGLPLSHTMINLLQSISQSYYDFENEHFLMERAMELSSDELLQANSRYLALINAFPDIYIVLQSDGTVIDFRMGAGAALPFTSQMFLHKRIQDIDFGQCENRFAGTVEGFREESRIVCLEQAVSNADKLLHLEARMISLTSDKILVVMRDRTEQKEAAESVLLEKERLSIVLKSLKEGVIGCSAKGRILVINPAALEIFKVEEEEACTMRLWELVIPLDLDDWQERILKMNTSEWPEHMVIHNSSDERRILTVNASSVSLAGYEESALVIVLNDITDEMRRKSQMELSQKMEGIGQLAAGIAHEINTPLQYIGDNLCFLEQSFTELIANRDFMLNEVVGGGVRYESSSAILETVNQYEADNDIPYLVKEIPSAISQSLYGIQHLKKLILALKDFSHPGNSGKQLEDINQMLETVFTISRNEWKHVAEVRMNLEPHLPLVPCVRDAINQVFLNIVINAAQAIQDQECRYQAVDLPYQGEIKVDSCQKGGAVCVRISDNGPGIPANLISRVFDPLFYYKGCGKRDRTGAVYSL